MRNIINNYVAKKTKTNQVKSNPVFRINLKNNNCIHYIIVIVSLDENKIRPTILNV